MWIPELWLKPGWARARQPGPPRPSYGPQVSLEVQLEGFSLRASPLVLVWKKLRPEEGRFAESPPARQKASRAETPAPDSCSFYELFLPIKM